MRAPMIGNFVAYGITSRAAKAAIRLAKEQGLKVGLFRPITIWPFPYAQIEAIARRSRRSSSPRQTWVRYSERWSAPPGRKCLFMAS